GQAPAPRADRGRETAREIGERRFCHNAPADVVAKDQLRLTDLRTEIEQLDAQTARVNALRAR
ncbi:MAG: hypothetical protein ACLP6Z_16395, partial [Steroidobacteraceae bacterium]